VWRLVGKSVSGTSGILSLLYGQYDMKILSVSGFKWCRRFKEGRQHVQDDPTSDRQNHKGQMQMLTEHKPWCTQIKDCTVLIAKKI
jgi:hypothetical protein